MPNDIKKRLADLSPEKRELLIKKLKSVHRNKFTKITKRPPDAGYPLSYQQRRLWFLHQLNSKSPFYNMPVALKIEGNLNLTALQFALNEIIRRHEILRSTFPLKNGEPTQAILPELHLSVKPEKIRINGESDLLRHIEKEFQKPFDLASGPLLRVRLFQLSPDVHIFILTMHHIVADGWSIGVFLKEFTELYDAQINGTKAKLTDLAIQYSDYAYWQTEWMKSEHKEKQLAYWKKQLADAPRILNLPFDKPRPHVQTFNGAHIRFVIPESLNKELRSFCQKENTTLFMTLLAAFQVLLFRYTHQNDINVGTAIAHRERPELQNLIGFFINTLVMRGNLSGNPTFSEFLRQIKKTAIDTYENQDLPFEYLVDELQIERNPAYSPLFQVLFVMQNTPRGKLERPNITISLLETQIGSVKFDLTLTLEENGNTISGLMGYNTDLFYAETVERMIAHFKQILGFIVHNADCPIEEIPLLNDSEKRLVLHEWNQTRQPFDEQVLIHQLFEAQVQKTPDAPAILAPDIDPSAGIKTRLTYRELNEMSNRIAGYLLQQGVQPEDKVAICIERSPELIAGLLSVLKAGGAYLPIDPAYPVERIRFMLKDAGVKMIITQNSLRQKFADSSASVVTVDDFQTTFGSFSAENPRVKIFPQQIAYVIYTSGSTGQPKGVEVEHRQLVNYIFSAKKIFELSEEDRVLQFSSISFDAAAEEIYPCLACGAALVLRNDAMISSAHTFLNSLAKFGVTVADLPTAYWHQIAAEIHDQNLQLPESVRLVIIGGERALPERVRQWQQMFASKVRLLNTYGPTETTVVATYWEAPANDRFLFAREVPIGKPVPNARAYVFDPRLQPVSVGMPGELCIGGKGVARGYLNRPELTAEKFVANPFIKDERLYRTGDLVRRLSDGNLEFLGRIDQQVKIRGFRIEPGEIESVLRKHPALRDVVVLAREDTHGDRRLVAYYTLQPGQKAEANELRAHIKAELPDYMVPSAFVRLDEIPISATGKINYRALPAPEYDRSSLEQAYAAPRNEVETILAEIWQEILSVDKIGIHDNFFELGGDSLRAAVFINRLQQALDEILYVVVIFDNQTIAQLSEYLISNFPKSVLRFVKTRFPNPGIEKQINTLLEQKADITEDKIEQMKLLLSEPTS
ncbi:MAG: amino acid adenylation domain-containing protein, partial [Calditrichaeota bacterium]|nr:amino acid adenylation domain-containing protein [Calditrichota bacterium]